MSVPEYFIGTIKAWLAPEDTARPASVTDDPAAAWELMGINEMVRLTDEGVTWEVPQEVNGERDLNDIFKSAAFRVSADQMIGFSLKDFRAEVVSRALNDATVTDVAAVSGVAGYKEFGVSGMGVEVATMALLVRVDNSPYPVIAGTAADVANSPYISEFWGPSVYEMSNFATVLGSRAVSLVPFMFDSLLSNLPAYKTAGTRMGSWRMQDANRLT